MKTGILFDLDGTLLNTLEDLRDATNANILATILVTVLGIVTLVRE